ncbi:MAG: efflux RND transporter permease subunit [Nocardioidaceae bacterium]
MSHSGNALQWIVRSALTFRVLVVTVALGIIALGVILLPKSQIEMMPEFEPPTVHIQTEALGLSAAEVEQLITVPMEADLLNGVAFLDQIRSESVPGLSSIELVFDEGTDIMEARQVVAERLTQAHALPNVSRPPAMLQPTSSTSRVMMVGLSSEELSLIELSVLARWKIRPFLLSVPGVANVAIWGQREQQLQVRVDPERLREKGVSLAQVVQTAGNALWVSPLSFVEASTPGTGGFIDTPNQRLTVQHISPIVAPRDLAQVTVEDTVGRQLRLGDVATVVEDHQPLIGDALVGDGPGLMLVVERFPDASTPEVTQGVEAALDELMPGLPGVTVDPTVYRPASTMETALADLGLMLLVGLALLVLVFGFAFRDWRAVLISIVTIPLSLVTAGLVLYLRDATINVMVLAGLVLALAVIIDDSIVDVDRIKKRLRERRERGESTAAAVIGASLEVRRPLLVATAATLVAAAPVLLFPGLLGEFSIPLVMSYALAVLASAAVALIVTPALALLLLNGAPERRDPRVVESIRRAYGDALSRCMQIPGRVLVAAIVVGVAVAGLVALPQLGDRELLPADLEPEVMIGWDGLPGTSLTEMARITAQATGELRSVPSVRDVSAHVGRAITSDQVVGVNSAEMWVSIDPDADHGAALDQISEVVNGYPGLFKEIGSYPEAQLRDIQTGTDDDIVVRVYGQDLEVLQDRAAEVQSLLTDVDGVVDPRVDLDPVEPVLEVKVDLAAAEQHAIKPGDVRRAAATLLSGVEVGSLFEEQKVFEVVVWGTEEVRHSLSSVNALLIDAPNGRHVRLGDVADVRISSAPNVIRRESVSRRVDVVANVDGRALDDVVADVEAAVQNVDFPLEYHAEVLDQDALGGGDGNMAAISAAALLVFFLILQAVLGSWLLATLITVTLPLALMGGGLAALAYGGRLTLVGAAALLAVLALTVRQTLTLIDRCDRENGSEPGQIDTARVLVGTNEQILPILWSAIGTGLLMLTIVSLGDSAGLAAIRPAAVVLLGGLLTATLYTLFLIPVLYQRFGVQKAPDPVLTTDPSFQRDASHFSAKAVTR